MADAAEPMATLPAVRLGRPIDTPVSSVFFPASAALDGAPCAVAPGAQSARQFESRTPARNCLENNSKITVEFLDGALDGALLGAIDKGVAAALHEHGAHVGDAVVLEELAQRGLARLRGQVADVQLAHLRRPVRRRRLGRQQGAIPETGGNKLTSLLGATHCRRRVSAQREAHSAHATPRPPPVARDRRPVRGHNRQERGRAPRGLLAQ